jgi:hypothetical protein
LDTPAPTALAVPVPAISRTTTPRLTLTIDFSAAMAAEPPAEEVGRSPMTDGDLARGVVVPNAAEHNGEDHSGPEMMVSV